LEFSLSQKDERLRRLEELVNSDPGEQVKILEKQKASLENILSTREFELRNAELKISQMFGGEDILNF
jgi:hypothetical protein